MKLPDNTYVLEGTKKKFPSVPKVTFFIEKNSKILFCEKTPSIQRTTKKNICFNAQFDNKQHKHQLNFLTPLYSSSQRSNSPPYIKCSAVPRPATVHPRHNNNYNNKAATSVSLGHTTPTHNVKTIKFVLETYRARGQCRRRIDNRRRKGLCRRLSMYVLFEWSKRKKKHLKFTFFFCFFKKRLDLLHDLHLCVVVHLVK